MTKAHPVEQQNDPLYFVKVICEMIEHGKDWDYGDQQVFILNDAAVTVTMKENGKLDFSVIVGEPDKLDITLGLTAEKEESV